MALTITKNDISGVFGNPAPLKITKSDISSVYAKREKPKQPVILRATPEESHSSKGSALRSDRQDMRYFAPLRSTQYDTPGQSSVILNEAKRSELAVCRGRQLVCRPRANARYGGARASQRLQPEESHSHKTGTLSNTSPFTITKSDISTIYSAPKTTDKTPPQTAYAGAKQKKKGSLADTLMAFGDRWKEGGRTSFENFASAADYSSIGISQMADMEKRLQNIDITDPQRISDAMKANYEQKGINSPAALATKQKIADRTRQQQQRQAQLYEKHRNAPFADRAVKLGFVTGAAAPSIITGGVVSPGFATALNAVNSYGAAQGQAISEGATPQQAGLYAAATAGKEYAINQLFGGIPYLSGKTYSPNAINILGEGAENVLSDVTQPYLKRIFYDKDAPAPTFKDLLSSFADGVDVSLFLNTAPEFVKIKPDDRMGIIHKAYAAELDRQIKQEMKEKHPELFEIQKENKVDTDSILGYNTDNNWAKDNGIITVREQEDFYSKVMSINTGTHFEKTKNGLYIIPTGDEYGVNNTLIFTDGDTVNPSIEKVVHINLDNETQIAEVRDYIYGKEAVQWRASRKDVKKIYGQEVFNVYNRQNSRHIRGKITGGKRTSRTNDKQYNRQQPDGRGDTGKSNETVENYLGENIYAYADEDRGGYSITLANGKKRKIVFGKTKGKWKYMVDGKVYSSIEERIREENRLLYSKNRLEE